MGGFTAFLSPSPSSLASEDEGDDGKSDGDDDANEGCQGDDCFSVTCPLSFVTKWESSFGYKSSHIFRGRVSIGHFC